jgi:hypothetical protein
MFLLCDVLPNINPSTSAIYEFVRGTADAAFLFDDAVVAYLEQIRGKAFRLRFLREAIEAGARRGAPATNEHQAWVEERAKLIEWFQEQPEALVERFKPFLRVVVS